MSELQSVRLAKFPAYEIFSDGTIVSHIKRKSRILRVGMKGKYLGFTAIGPDGHRHSVYVHRVVCEAFHGAPQVGHACRHLDGNCMNNAASNLAWGTYSENARDKDRHGTSPVGERHGMAKLTRATVERMRALRAADGRSYHKLAAQFGVSPMTAFRAVTGQAWSK